MLSWLPANFVYEWPMRIAPPPDAYKVDIIGNKFSETIDPFFFIHSSCSHLRE